MKHAEILSSRSSDGTDWQILGELKLLIGFDSAVVIDTWIKEKLSPLKLQADFINRILKSAQDAAGRFSESMGPRTEVGQLHIRVIAPLSHKLDEKTWGFFRIEKLESTREAKNPPDHYIEFHLYFE